jgi:hypothetical protein
MVIFNFWGRMSAKFFFSFAILYQSTVDERPNLGYDSEKVKNFSPQTGFEPTPLGEMSFQAVSSTTEL